MRIFICSRVSNISKASFTSDAHKLKPSCIYIYHSHSQVAKWCTPSFSIHSCTRWCTHIIFCRAGGRACTFWKYWSRRWHKCNWWASVLLVIYIYICFLLIIISHGQYHFGSERPQRLPHCPLFHCDGHDGKRHWTYTDEKTNNSFFYYFFSSRQVQFVLGLLTYGGTLLFSDCAQRKHNFLLLMGVFQYGYLFYMFANFYFQNYLKSKFK